MKIYYASGVVTFANVKYSMDEGQVYSSVEITGEDGSRNVWSNVLIPNMLESIVFRKERITIAVIKWTRKERGGPWMSHYVITSVIDEKGKMHKSGLWGQILKWKIETNLGNITAIIAGASWYYSENTYHDIIPLLLEFEFNEVSAFYKNMNLDLLMIVSLSFIPLTLLLMKPAIFGHLGLARDIKIHRKNYDKKSKRILKKMVRKIVKEGLKKDE